MEAIVIAACRPVPDEVVGRVPDHKGRHHDVGLHHIFDAKRADGQIVLEDVVRLNSILEQKVMSRCSVTHVVLHSDEVRVFYSDYPREGLVDCVPSGVGGRGFTIHVEVDAVPSWDLRLPAESEFGVRYLAFKAVEGFTTEHQMGAVFADGG